MRDPMHDQASSERWAEYTDSELIALVKSSNCQLLRLSRQLADIWDEGMRLRMVALAETIHALRYELARRRVPPPSVLVSQTQTGAITNSHGVAIGAGAQSEVRHG